MNIPVIIRMNEIWQINHSIRIFIYLQIITGYDYNFDEISATILDISIPPTETSSIK